MAYTEEELFDMSDEELEQAYKSEQADERSPETAIEEKQTEEEVDEPEEASTDDEVVEDDVAEEPETEESDDNSGEEEAEETEGEDLKEEPKAEVEKAKEEPQPEQKLKFKADGQEFEFTEKEIKEQFGKVFAQAMNYTKKMQAIAPYRGMIASIEEQNLTQEDLNLAIDVLKGDKNALAAVLKKTGVDALDLDTDESGQYQPTNYGRNETELAIREVVSEIGNDKEYAITHHVVEKQWDDRSRETFLKNPALIKGLHSDVKNGVFDKVSPMAMKMKVLDGGRRSDIEYYVEAGKQFYGDMRQAQLQEEQAQKAQVDTDRLAKVKAEEAKRKAAVVTGEQRKAAAPTKSRVKKVTDYLDDSDEGFESWYKQLEEKF